MFLLNLKVPAWFLIEQSRSVHRQLQPGQDKRLSRENERRRCRVPLAFSVICRLSVSDPLVELEGRLPLPPLPPLPRAACSRHLLGLRGARKAELREDAVRPCPARAERLRLELFGRELELEPLARPSRKPKNAASNASSTSGALFCRTEKRLRARGRERERKRQRELLQAKAKARTASARTAWEALCSQKRAMHATLPPPSCKLHTQ